MQIPVLSSTLILTLLLTVGLVFFIRASAKDRTEVSKLVAEQSQESLLEQIYAYFSQRSYRIATVDADTNTVAFEGIVRPSLFLSIFLTGLASVGTLCLALVLALLFPHWSSVFPGLAILAPLAGIFYWKKAGRAERVLLRVESIATEDQSDQPSEQSLVTVTAHRDELIELRRSLPLKEIDANA
jgi:ABC-type transport system involved in cytochrome bd biosynthesis fused ATPase/permease subunit